MVATLNLFLPYYYSTFQILLLKSSLMLQIPPVPLLKTNEPPSGNIMAALRAGKQTVRKRPLF